MKRMKYAVFFCAAIVLLNGCKGEKGIFDRIYDGKCPVCKELGFTSTVKVVTVEYVRQQRENDYYNTEGKYVSKKGPWSREAIAYKCSNDHLFYVANGKLFYDTLQYVKDAFPFALVNDTVADVGADETDHGAIIFMPPPVSQPFEISYD